MGQHATALTAEQIRFIGEQKIFFVGTATADSRVNVSPKGMDSLRRPCATPAPHDPDVLRL